MFRSKRNKNNTWQTRMRYRISKMIFRHLPTRMQQINNSKWKVTKTSYSLKCKMMIKRLILVPIQKPSNKITSNKFKNWNKNLLISLTWTARLAKVVKASALPSNLEVRCNRTLLIWTTSSRKTSYRCLRNTERCANAKANLTRPSKPRKGWKNSGRSKNSTSENYSRAPTGKKWKLWRTPTSKKWKKCSTSGTR